MGWVGYSNDYAEIVVIQENGDNWVLNANDFSKYYAFNEDFGSGVARAFEPVQFIDALTSHYMVGKDGSIYWRKIDASTMDSRQCQQENAMKIASWLKEQKKVTDVYYVGLPEHSGYEINQKQSRGAGSMISFRTDTEETARKVLERVKLISYAESLGGVESLITYPMLQTHGDVPVEIRERLGITETFLRLSVGIENVDDLIADLEQALA